MAVRVLCSRVRDFMDWRSVQELAFEKYSKQYPLAWILEFRENCMTSCDLYSGCINVESRPAKEFENATRAGQQRKHCVNDVVQM